MEFVTMCLDNTNKLDHWYVRHNNVYCLHPLLCLTYQCSNLLVLSKHKVMYSI